MYYKLAPSILAADFCNLGLEVSTVAQAGYAGLTASETIVRPLPVQYRAGDCTHNTRCYPYF